MLRLSLLVLALTAAAPAQQARNFLQQVLGSAALDDRPLLSPEAPRFDLLLANLPLEPVAGSSELRSPATGQSFDLLYERLDGIDFYRLRRRAESPLVGDQVKLTFYFERGFED